MTAMLQPELATHIVQLREIKVSKMVYWLLHKTSIFSCMAEGLRPGVQFLLPELFETFSQVLSF